MVLFLKQKNILRLFSDSSKILQGWTLSSASMNRAAKPAGMMLDDQLAGDHAFDSQGSSLEFTEKGSILWKGFKIGDKGVMVSPDGARPSSGTLPCSSRVARPCCAHVRAPC